MALQGVADDGVAPDAPLRPTLTWGAVTHGGGVRDHNEDAFFVSEDVCVVADGMGGHDAGEVASQLVTQIVSETFGSRRLQVTELPGVVTNLNDAVRTTGARNDTRGMGTTLVGVALTDNGEDESAVIFHVGDSRCYRLVDGTMNQVTTDHSHVQELLDGGRITQNEVRTHPLRNVITRALGAEEKVRADFHVLPDADCRLLLCSDGLSNELDDQRIAELLLAWPDPRDAAGALLDAAIEGTAGDNVTVIVVDLRFVGRDPTHDQSGGAGGHREAEITAELGQPVDSLALSTAEPTAEVEIPRVDRPPTGQDAAAWDATNQP